MRDFHQSDGVAREATGPAWLFDGLARIATTGARGSIAEVVGAILDQAIELFGARAVHVCLASEDSLLTLAGERFLSADLAEQLKRIPFDAPLLAARAARTRELQLIDGPTALGSDSLSFARSFAASVGATALASIPLVVEDRLIGVVTMAFLSERVPSSKLIAALRTLALMWGMGLVSAGALQRARQMGSQLEAVRAASLAVGGSLDLEVVLRTVVEQARQITGARYAALGIVREWGTSFSPWVFSGLTDEQAKAIGAPPRPVGLIGAVPRESQIVRLRDLTRDERFQGFPPHHPEMHSLLGVPIRYQGRSVGNLYLAEKADAPEFSEEDRLAVELLAQHAAIAVEHARVHERIVQEMADRRRAEEVLRQSEERFRLLVEGVKEYAIYMLDPAGHVTSWNTGAERIKGYRAEEILGEHYSRFFVPAALEAGVPDAQLELAAKKGRFEGEGLRVCKDGSQFWADVVITALRDESGVLRGFSKITRNTTDRKRAEEALRHSEESLAITLDSIGDGVIATDLQGRITRINPVAEQLAGWPKDLALGRPLLEVLKIVNEQSHDPAPNPVDRALTEGVAVLLANHTALVARDGTFRPIADSCAPIRDLNGQVAGAVFVFRDVTEERRAEEALLAAEVERENLIRQLRTERSWLQTVIDNSPVGFILLEGPDARHIVANRRAEKLFGRALQPEEGTGQYIGQVCRPDGTPLPARELPGARALRGETIGGEEYLLRQPDGHEIPVLMSAAPLVDEARILGAVITFMDIAPIKELERLREEWTSIIAHDLRHPLQTILLYASLLARGAGQEQKAISHIQQSVRHLDRMISDLLDVSRLEANRLELRLQSIDLRALVRSAIERHLPEALDRPLHIDAADDVPAVEADPQRIEQVIANLLSNAIKYGRAGSEIEVQVRALAGKAQVTVRNHGDGIAEDELGRLFKRFHRTEEARRGATGMGLGLYIAKGLIEAHGGRIWVESAPGETTSFHFALPARPAEGPVIRARP